MGGSEELDLENIDIMKVLEGVLNTPPTDDEMEAWAEGNLGEAEKALLEARLDRELEKDGFWEAMEAAPQTVKLSLDVNLELASSAWYLEQLTAIRGLRDEPTDDPRVWEALDDLAQNGAEDVRLRAQNAITARLQNHPR